MRGLLGDRHGKGIIAEIGGATGILGMGEVTDMEARTKCILQRVCVYERSTVGIRCIEREGKRGRGKKKGK